MSCYAEFNSRFTRITASVFAVWYSSISENLGTWNFILSESFICEVSYLERLVLLRSLGSSSKTHGEYFLGRFYKHPETFYSISLWKYREFKYSLIELLIGYFEGWCVLEINWGWIRSGEKCMDCQLCSWFTQTREKLTENPGYEHVMVWCAQAGSWYHTIDRNGRRSLEHKQMPKCAHHIVVLLNLDCFKRDPRSSSQFIVDLVIHPLNDKYLSAKISPIILLFFYFHRASHGNVQGGSMHSMYKLWKCIYNGK